MKANQAEEARLSAKPSASAAFLAQQPFGLFINNHWIESVGNDKVDSIEPASGATLATFTDAQPADVDAAVKAARNALNSAAWSQATPAQRTNWMWRLADLVEANLDEIAELETLDQGKPLAVSKYAEIPAAIKQLRYFAGAATKIEGSTLDTSISHQPAGKRITAFTRKEPIGVVAAIVPWNSPLMLAVMKVAPALAAGCTLVVKPAEDTSLTALRFAELAAEAGFPPGVLNVVTGRGSVVGNALAAHADVDKVAFTGSSVTGRAIIEAAKSNLKKVALELGGKSPVVILEDADLDDAISAAANGIFFNSGQVCVAGSRLYAHRSIFDQVVAGVCEIGRKLKAGPGLEDGVELGPLVSAKQLAAVSGYVERAVAAGAMVELGGKPMDRVGYFMQPTVLTNVRQDMEIVQEEAFGPVLVCQPFDDIEEVLQLANDSKYGLAASIWTQNFSRAHRLAEGIRAGKVWINCHYMFDPGLPIGGMKQSGWGRDNGMQALESYLELKTICACI